MFDYFSKRAAISHIFTGINQEQPILAYYSLRSQNLSGILSTDKAELTKLRQSYLLHLHDNRAEYEERERMALNVNAIVHELHTRHASPEDYLPVELQSHLEPVHERVAYLSMAAMLNGLPMSNKVFIGRTLENILANLRNSGGSDCFAFKPLRKELVFVFACFSRLARGERAQRIYRLLPGALHRYKVSEGLAVGIDADSSATGYELTWIRGRRYFSEEDQKIGETFFPGPIDTLVTDLFGKPRPYQPDGTAELGFGHGRYIANYMTVPGGIND